MGRHGHRKRSALNALRLEYGQNGAHVFARPRNHQTLRPIDGCNADLATLQCDRRRHLCLAGEDGRHLPLLLRIGGSARHQPPAQRTEHEAVFEAHHTRHDGRAVLAGAVAGDRVGFNAPRPPQRAERNLERAERRERKFDARQQLLALGAKENLLQRAVEVRRQQARALVQRSAKVGFACIQVAPHAGIVRTLSREEEDHGAARTSGNDPGEDTVCLPGGCKRGKLRAQLFQRTSQQRQSIGQVRTRRVCCEGNRGGRQLGVIAQMCHIALRQRAQRSRRARRECQQVGACLVFLPVPRRWA